MVNVAGVPTQLTAPLVYVGVTVMVAVTGEEPALVAVKAAMFPLPLAAKPIEVLLLVHAYVTVPPVAGLLKVTALVVEPAHTTWFATGVKVATG